MMLPLSGLLSLVLWSTPSAPRAVPCAVRGVWALESVTIDGKPDPLRERRQDKIVTASHYAWTSQAPGPKTLRSAADSLAAYRTGAFGSGTYRVTDSTYTERLDMFSDPLYVGREVTATCRISGNRWYHSFEWSLLESGREAGRRKIAEVWRRIE